MTDPRPEYTCPRCGLTSHHPMDVRHQYCVRCHMFENDNPSMDEKDIPSPPSRTHEQYEADKAAGIVRCNYPPLFKEDFEQRQRDRKAEEEA